MSAEAPLTSSPPPGGHADRFLPRALRTIAEAHGLRYESRSGGWIQRVTDGASFVDVMGYQFGINAAVATAVARDKAAAAEYLAIDSIPVIETELVLDEVRQAWTDGGTPRQSLDRAIDRTGVPAVVKPNEGSSGRGVEMVRSREEAWAHTSMLLEKLPSVAVQPLLDLAVEERWVLLGDEPVVWYRKRPAETGSPMATFNLTLGATVDSWGVDGGDPAHLDLARRARRSIGLSFCAVDLVTTRGGEVAVLEVNSGTSFEHLVSSVPDAEPTALAAYRDAILVGLGRRELVRVDP